MATQFSTATAIPPHHPSYHHHAYRKSIQYSPNGSATNTPANVSPTSPRTLTTTLPLQRHQGIYPSRTAIGVPAALRKTEKPGTKSPPRLDSGIGSPSSGWHINGSIHVSNHGMATPMAQVGNEDMHSIYSDVPLSPTAGPITRNHWQADSSTPVCSASMCQEPFGFFQRRHHCRKCGGIFCWQHSSKQVRLDDLARFHPDGVLHRACERCYSSFREWEHLRSSRTNSESSDSSIAAMETPAPAMPAKRPENLRVGSLAQSFQGAWNWSTF